MKYNFDEVIERRHTNALNTDGFRSYIFHVGPEKEFPFKDEEFVRMWVADMEFATPDQICQAIKERVDKRIFGYTQVFDNEYYDIFSKWCKTYYDWSFPKEELVFSSGIIPALYEFVEELLEADEKMLITTPAYGFFQHAAEYNKIELACSALKNDHGHFSIDLEDLEKKASDPKVKLLLWCNPHNPSGRMWTDEELKQVAEIVEKYNLWIISDEIHCDLIRENKKHIPMGKVMPEYKKLVTCMSASKTFNMAGLMFSNIIIRDAALKLEFISRDKSVGFVNPLSLVAHKTAFEKCGDWLMELRKYLDGNFNFLKEFLETNLPDAVFEIPEATYLAWVDLNPYLSDVEDLPAFFADKAGVLLEGGDALFVGNAKGFIRLNLAMPQSIIREGMERIRTSIMKHKKEL